MTFLIEFALAAIVLPPKGSALAVLLAPAVAGTATAACGVSAPGCTRLLGQHRSRPQSSHRPQCAGAATRPERPPDTAAADARFRKRLGRSVRRRRAYPGPQPTAVTVST